MRYSNPASSFQEKEIILAIQILLQIQGSNFFQHYYPWYTNIFPPVFSFFSFSAISNKKKINILIFIINLSKTPTQNFSFCPVNFNPIHIFLIKMKKKMYPRKFVRFFFQISLHFRRNILYTARISRRNIGKCYSLNYNSFHHRKIYCYLLPIRISKYDEIKASYTIYHSHMGTVIYIRNSSSKSHFGKN